MVIGDESLFPGRKGFPNKSLPLLDSVTLAIYSCEVFEAGNPFYKGVLTPFSKEQSRENGVCLLWLVLALCIC